MLGADSHYCTPEVLRFCRARRLDYTLGVATSTKLRKHITALEASTAAHAAAAGGEKLRRFTEFFDGGNCLKIGGVGSRRSLSEEKGQEFGHSQGRHRPTEPASPPILRQSQIMR